MGSNYTQAADALRHIDPGCSRDDWWRILAAIKSEFGKSGYSLAYNWSAQSDKFNQRDFDSTWRSLNGSGIGIASVFYEAKQCGYSAKADIPAARKPVIMKAPPPQKKSLKPYARSLLARANRGDTCVSQHPYAVTKGIDWACGAGRGKASGSQIGQNVDCILVPKRDEAGICGVECIPPNGKDKQSFGDNGILTLGNTLDLTLPIYIVEGWADAASLWRMMGNVVVIAAFGKGNMEKVYDGLGGRDRTIVEDAS